MSVLAPRLSDLDRRVLAALGDGPQRAARVAALVHGQPTYECGDCHKVTRVSVPVHAVRGVHGLDLRAVRRRASWEGPSNFRCRCGGTEQRILAVRPGEEREIREILRGLEACGCALCRGGWWRRA